MASLRRTKDSTLEVYKLAVQMSDSSANRRLVSNTLYITIVTALLGFMGILISNIESSSIDITAALLLLLSLVGISLSITWLSTIKSFRDLSSAKWEVILKLEEKLQNRPFTDEWKLLKTDDYKLWKEKISHLTKPRKILLWMREHNKYYTPQAEVEIIIPKTFLAIFIIVGLSCIFLLFI